MLYPDRAAGHNKQSRLELDKADKGKLGFTIHFQHHPRYERTVLTRDDVVDVYNVICGWLAEEKRRPTYTIPAIAMLEGAAEALSTMEQQSKRRINDKPRA